MSRKAGALLWNRMRVVVDDGNVDVDTGLTQLTKSFAAQSPNEPPLGIAGTSPPAGGALPASRVMVIPMAPMAAWDDVTHGEPYFNTTTGTVHVEFAYGTEGSTTINVLFWDPHTMVGPGDADPYNDAE